MTDHVHLYRIGLEWSGSTKQGWRSYDRTHRWWAITGDGASVTATDHLTADPEFLGEPGLVNPEQLVVAAASSCQLLSFLALAAKYGVDVVAYVDTAEGVMPVLRGSMSISQIDLHPTITVRPDDDAAGEAPSDERLRELVERAHQECYVANSLRTDVLVHPVFKRV